MNSCRSLAGPHVNTHRDLKGQAKFNAVMKFCPPYFEGTAAMSMTDFHPDPHHHL
jgi:hypothetical protein